MRREFNTEAEPITNVFEALAKLHGAYRVGPALHLKHGPPRIERHLAGGAYDMELVGIHVWYVSPAVATQLKNRCWVQGRPRWGHTDENELILSDGGEYILWEHVKQVKILVEMFAALGEPKKEPPSSTWWAE